MYRSSVKFERGLRIIKKNTYSLFSSFIEGDKGSKKLPLPLPVIKRGKGPYLYDYDENRFVDFDLGGGSLLLGHAPPKITSIIKSWLSRGYGAGFPSATHEMLSRTASGVLIGNHPSLQCCRGKWFYYNSPYEACSALLPLLKLCGRGGRGIYAAGAGGIQSIQSRPFRDVLLPSVKIENLDNKKIQDIDYIVLRCDGRTEKPALEQVIKEGKEKGKLIITDETDVESFIHLIRTTDLTRLIDIRIFGSWISSGLSFGCIYAGDHLFSSIPGSAKHTWWEELVFQMGFPPLYKVKTTLRFLGILKKSGGMGALLERYALFSSLLNGHYFDIRHSIPYIRETGRLGSHTYQELRFTLMKNNLYFPVFMKSPLCVSFAHSPDLLKSCADKINLLFTPFYR